MKIEFKKAIIIGYLILLLINVVEIRAGIVISILQLIFGLAIFLPKIITVNFWHKIRRFEPGLIGLYFLSLLTGIYMIWYDAPNHMFLLLVLTLLLLYIEKTADFGKNLRWILVIVMGFATVHKLLTPNFMSGDFIGLRIASGDFFRPLLISGAVPEIKEELAQNASTISEFEFKDPNFKETVKLRVATLPFTFFKDRFSYMIVGMEFLLTALLLFFPWKNFSMFILLIFTTSIGFVVAEFEFAATLLFMGWLVCPSRLLVLKKAFSLVFSIYALVALFNNIFWL